MENNMNKIFSICIALAMLVSSHVLAAGSKAIKIPGEYSNIITFMLDDPHQSGYAVSIYKREDGFLFGNFTFAAGSVEGSVGKLFDLNVDGNKVEFKAKTSAYGTDRGPSKELFEFKGVMHKTALIGTLTLRDGYDLTKPGSVKRVILKREKGFTPLSYKSYQTIFDKDAW
jgi:hypothetical protein